MNTHAFTQFVLGDSVQSPAAPTDEAAAKEVSQLVSGSLVYRLYENLSNNGYDADEVTDHLEMLCDTENHFGLGMITINALAAADSAIVPVQAQYLPAKGMTQLMKTIGKVKKQINPALKVDGVLLTLANMRTNLARATADALRQQYGSVLKIY